MKIGVELASFRLPLRDALCAAAECGVEAVEIDARGEITPQIPRTGIRQLRKLLDDLRLRVAAISFRTRGGFSTPEGLDQRVSATKAAMELAYHLGASVVVNHLGPIPTDPNSSSWRLLIEVLEDLGAYGNRVGGLLAAETGNESSEQLARVLAAVPTGTLGIDLNPGKLLLGGFSPIEAVTRLGPSIFHVHASDAAVDSPQQGGHPVRPGRGAVDYPALLGALDEFGYRGYFTVQAPIGEDPRRDVAAAVKYLASL
jgi:sugar phosphate isomerase/epimerase